MAKKSKAEQRAINALHALYCCDDAPNDDSASLDKEVAAVVDLVFRLKLSEPAAMQLQAVKESIPVKYSHMFPHEAVDTMANELVALRRQVGLE